MKIQGQEHEPDIYDAEDTGQEVLEEHCQPLKEASAEFDTHDLYRHLSSGQPEPVHVNSSKRTKSEGKLRVFVLPFTHVDPGWLKTFDAYTEDTNKILDNMHNFMTKNPAMKFMWAEFVFFEKWWSKQNDQVKKDVRELVRSGRLELASGSWVMTDEANAYFPVSVDNIVEGHQYLINEFGIHPSVIWSNDPFGYSNSVPYLFSQAGMKRTVINRIHHGLKTHLQGDIGIPFKWRQYFDLSGVSDVWTQVLPYTHYDILNSCGPNAGHCCEFDFKRMTHWSCPGPKPVPITDNNVASKANTLINELKTMSHMYEAPVLLMMHGDDFRFDMIEEWHQHHDNFMPLFDHINKGDQVNISFGTFTDYFNHLEEWYRSNNKEPPTLTGDFFPYRCALGDMWTGYFTTRPFYKRQGRYLHSLIRAADLLSYAARAKVDKDTIKSWNLVLQNARRTLSLFQHHDAITGTSKRHVMDDYSHLLYSASNETKELIEKAQSALSAHGFQMIEFPLNYTQISTKQAVSITSLSSAVLRVFNPLPYAIDDVITVRVDSRNVAVYQDNAPVEAQLEPYISNAQIAQNTYQLAFVARLLPLTTVSFVLKQEANPESTTIAKVFTVASQIDKWKGAMLPNPFAVTEIQPDKFRLTGKSLTTKHDPATGLITEMSTSNGESHKIANSFVAYKNSRGGAYLMRVADKPDPYITGDVARILVAGPVQQSIHLFTQNIYQTISAKNIRGSLANQLSMSVRIDIAKEYNTEVMMRFDVAMDKRADFSDSVGMQLLRRDHFDKLSVQANYYPMPSAAVMENDQQRITIASNLEHGVRFLDTGVEIGIDRMLAQDDGKGLGSSADSLPTDLKPVQMEFKIVLEKSRAAQTNEHFTAHSSAGHLAVQTVLYPPIVLAGVGKYKVSILFTCILKKNAFSSTLFRH
ncbi:hypothetical protein WR25_02103 isoform F [Diploscapter pachys]|uniref:mannosyl-oligosaccharide 1,3-1,6-alpha-mannosidase n=1 Tax=Diploscapter pachys TaxID=2018661 RepID=A0A2A2K6T8_9BILA|nr:hypothetical protein WR25_02103 isoform C [Diploscapter pachys]PAV69615.1 hypothetical protein WR25_02103 isoform F [Diploscapter pachys]